ncbi:MAG TPA: helix-turn-helix transcriptional regulator, partial [Nitrospira sp.]
MVPYLLGELETMVLLSVAELGDDAYGAAIRRDVSRRLRREYSVGAIHTTLQRLEDRDFLRSRESDPLPIRGGRARRYFQTTTAGRVALKRSVELRT